MSPVSLEELLARFILSKRQIRQNMTLKPEAFMPHPYIDLSVTRHHDLSKDEIWSIGWDVADKISKPLLGRADVRAHEFESRGLSINEAPVPSNPNHADVTGWPADKSAQKIIALEISDAAGKMTTAP